MGIYEFMSGSPVLTFVIAISIIGLAQTMIKGLIVIPLRRKNIKDHGWPPAHCDADGDFKEDDD